MSDYERNKGKLIPVDVDTEHFSEDDYDTYFENGFAVIDGEVYEVEWEVEGVTDAPDFAEVKINEDGTINFHTYHYNGVAHWTEVVENELENIGEKLND